MGSFYTYWLSNFQFDSGYFPPWEIWDWSQTNWSSGSRKWDCNRQEQIHQDLPDANLWGSLSNHLNAVGFLIILFELVVHFSWRSVILNLGPHDCSLEPKPIRVNMLEFCSEKKNEQINKYWSIETSVEVHRRHIFWLSEVREVIIQFMWLRIMLH